MEYVLILLGIVLIGWIVFTQFGGRRQLTVDTARSEADAQQIVAQAFGVAWKQVNGPGGVNFRPRFRYQSPVLSIDFHQPPNRGCQVHFWVSESGRAWGGLIRVHAQLAWRKRWMLERRLLAGSPTQNDRTEDEHGPRLP